MILEKAVVHEIHEKHEKTKYISAFWRLPYG